MAHLLHTVDDVIDALGGTTKAAEFTEQINLQTVSNWRRRGRMPPELYLRMTQELERLGFTAPPELWKQAPTADQRDLPASCEHQ